MGGIKGVKRAEGKGGGEIKRKIDEKSEKWNIREMSEIGGMKEGMVEGVKGAEGMGRGEIQRKIDKKNEKWSIGQRTEMR